MCNVNAQCQYAIYINDISGLLNNSKNRVNRSCSSPTMLKTAISPDVLCQPKCTPDTRSNVSVLLNCVYCVYFQVYFFISALYFKLTGWVAFQT